MGEEGTAADQHGVQEPGTWWRVCIGVAKSC
jgi:hypothetical protein